jgi:hypothetical protein
MVNVFLKDIFFSSIPFIIPWFAVVLRACALRVRYGLSAEFLQRAGYVLPP